MATGCAGDATTLDSGGAADAGADAGSGGEAGGGGNDPQLPPLGQAALEPWLAAGHYLAWRCEDRIFPMRLNGAHGRHRICSNALVIETPVRAGTAYPVGAASVKELFDTMDRPNGFAVGVKIAPGLGDATWYWYERIGRLATLSPVADGIGVRACGPQCHAAAPHDNVFLRAP
ncbi:MAG TPA: hypothetical protein VGG33_16530 [Polyangia bacterium]